MTVIPVLRQLLVIASPQLAAFAVGGAVTYPSAILQQLSSNESTIQLDLNSSSWIGSIDGIAGIPSIFMPVLMQWKGRKFAFIAACLISIFGWIITYNATTTISLYFSESLHGLGTHCILSVSLLSISEMVAPKYRNMSLLSFHMVQTFGQSLIGVLARFVHWKVISLIMCTPLTIALIIACIWPESPYWLAYRGEFGKSKEAFLWLRGTAEDSKQELNELILACREENLMNQKVNKMSVTYFLDTLKSKDFILPCIFMFLLLNSMYWGGLSVVVIYYTEILRRGTANEYIAGMGSIIANTILFLVIAIMTVISKFVNNKTIVMISNIGTTFTLLGASLVTYLQSVGALPKDSLLCLYFMIFYMIAISLGVHSFAIAAELMPVKHRGLGGAMYVIFIGILHTSSLKVAPYLFLSIGLYGTFLIFSINSIVCGTLIWKFVPETKDRTLQEIKDYYSTLSFRKKYRNVDVDLNLT